MNQLYVAENLYSCRAVFGKDYPLYSSAPFMNKVGIFKETFLVPYWYYVKNIFTKID